eukprot:TRINITY_DN44601_c0_g1_i1.p1 TRINITY_DN44601_c0_g1~~TRINITY_DN44601_c0_g1_i1.p1  ORF type:complete len:407 (+),score=93.62 TRINITY_DN44601_c0_g1_i1:68-1288(+)
MVLPESFSVMVAKKMGAYLLVSYHLNKAAQRLAIDPNTHAAYDTPYQAVRAGKGWDAYRIRGKAPRYITALPGPKYHAKNRPSDTHLYKGTGYYPKQLTQRTKYSPVAQHTYNNVEGGATSLYHLSDPDAVKQDLIDGKYTIAQNGSRHYFQMRNEVNMHNNDNQVTAQYLLDSLTFMNPCGDFHPYLKREYNLTDEESASLGSTGFARLLASRYPGWRHDRSHLNACAWASVTKTPANQRVVIKRFGKDPDREHTNQDKGYFLSLSSDTISHPSEGIKTPLGMNQGETLSMHGGFHDHMTMQRLRVSDRKDNQLHFRSVQESIKFCETMGMDWEVDYSGHSTTWPSDRHKLYADNFPFRGNFKKRLNALGSKRQKGGEFALVARREWDPTLTNHFEEKTTEELFA